MLANLRESGALEQDADVVTLCAPSGKIQYSEEGGKSTEGLAEIIIGKQRNGPIGDVSTHLRQGICAFENLAMPSFNEYIAVGRHRAGVLRRTKGIAMNRREFFIARWVPL